MSEKIVRCKFQCTSVSESTSSQPGGFNYTAKFCVQADGSEETKNFFRYTPYGNLEIGTYKADHFHPGKFYYLDITEAPD